ncbi:parathyroid hormone 4 [Nerophis lumbriciformis]|uniref:parathyroid hormone 4 n=1 Tax=Nerophis lumbriciformis TaxID=546530 RepID=UPI002AE02A17|nr:parathyroid hormone 4 [Nerophis lumbriciformis]
MSPSGHKMQMFHTHVLGLVLLLLLVFPTGLCEQNQSRRAVSEHQLMHDRGHSIQSLKRLIWLSSAMEGLHTAQVRSAALGPRRSLNLLLEPDLLAAQGPQAAHLQNLLRDFLVNPYLTQVSEWET